MMCDLLQLSCSLYAYMFYHFFIIVPLILCLQADWSLSCDHGYDKCDDESMFEEPSYRHRGYWLPYLILAQYRSLPWYNPVDRQPASTKKIQIRGAWHRTGYQSRPYIDKHILEITAPRPVGTDRSPASAKTLQDGANLSVHRVTSIRVY